MEKQIEGFNVNSDIELPVLQQEGKKNFSPEDVTLEAIVSGMLTIIAYNPEHKHFNYYRDFVLASQSDAISELNTAAIAKEQQKDFPFAEELFLAVYHLLPQAASCINLATLYSAWAVEEKKEKDEKAEDFYLEKALHTLEEGLEKFGENADLLGELGAFHTYLGNLEDAENYLSRYMRVAPEGEKKQKFKKMLKDVTFQLESDNEIKQAYDFMMLQEEDKAIETIDKFIKKNPRLWHGHFIKGWALRKKGMYKEAQEELLKCLESGEANSDTYNELSICALENGERELAKAYLDTAVDMDSDNLTLTSNLAYLHLMDDELDDAKLWIEKARKLSPEDATLKAMLEEYTKRTGESFGPIIEEEYVHSPEKKESEEEGEGEDDGYEEELRAIEEDDEDEECSCNHHHDEGECHCHHHSEEDDECHCHHHHKK